MSKLTNEIIQEFIKRGYFKSEGAVKNFISQVKTDEGLDCTQPAAAQVAAKIKGFSIKRRLKKEDKGPSNLSEIVEKYRNKNSNSSSKVKKLNKPNFKNKIQNSNDPIEKAAYFNASLYSDIYILENKLRLLIFKQLGNDLSWWKKEKVTQPIIDYANKIAEDDKKTPWIPRADKHPLYLVTLKHLSKIIELNWTRNFDKLGRMTNFLTYLDDLLKIRNCLAHNISLGSRDKKEVETQVPKILSLTKQNYSI
ncbi:hypothetical protein J4233_03760 [Candidatus Pacearchaeota archaeon]|nr:hypothetical protein [Candidatus Pacearchaeota archaeon]